MEIFEIYIINLLLNEYYIVRNNKGWFFIMSIRKNVVLRSIYYIIIATILFFIILLIVLYRKDLKEFSYINVSFFDYCIQKTKHETSKLFNKEKNEEFVFIPTVDKREIIVGSKNINKDDNKNNNDNYEKGIMSAYKNFINSYVEDLSGYNVDDIANMIESNISSNK